jgi:hypothetical protein
VPPAYPCPPVRCLSRPALASLMDSGLFYTIIERTERHLNHPASLYQSHAIIHVLDDLEGGVDAGGFCEGFHEGVVPFLAVENFESILISTATA